MIGTLLVDRYRLDAEIGAGGMSTVYRAWDETLQRDVAIKILHREISDQPDQLERFRREARAVAGLSHANVVTVIDAGEDEDGHPFIVFEHVAGETLKQRIKRLGRLDIPEAVAYAIEIGRALGAAHDRRLVHRDVKPQNVLIDEEGRAKVTDFGIARSLEADGLTATGRVLGTTDYVSPEQAMGHAVDGRSDQYSLGVVMYEMLSGEVPFKADSPVGVAMKHVRETMPDVQRRRAEVSSALAAIMERATSKDPEKRYPSAAAMVEDLEEALAVEAARAGSTTGEATTVLESVERPRWWASRRRVSLAGIGILLVAAAVAFAVVAVTRDGGGAADGGASQRISATRLDIERSKDFDPDGDGRERPDRLGLAIDGNPTTTAWSTETYVARDMGRAKAGVGLYLDLGKPVSAKALEVRSAGGGWDFEVLGASGAEPPEQIEGWSRLGGALNAAERQTVELTTGDSSYRYYLVWITKLAPGDGGFRVEVADVRLFG